MALMIDTREVNADDVTLIHDFGDDCGIFAYDNGASFIGSLDDDIIFPLSNVVRGDNVVEHLIKKWEEQ